LKILRVANSSTYGCSGEVRSLQHAVVVLGFRALRTLTVSVAAADTFAAGGAGAEQRSALWQHSMGCGVVAAAVAQYVEDVKPDDAFLAGIVHDAGKLVLLDLASETYELISKETNELNLISVEQDVFSVDHQELGLRCADEWGLPLEVADAIGDHHNALLEEIDSPMSNLIAVANVLARKWGIGSDPSDTEFDHWPLLHSIAPSIDEDVLQEVSQEAVTQFAEMRSALGG
jgi:putative nucleotidyltransferase with HDIG domain